MDDPHGLVETARDTLEIVWGFEDFRGVQEQVRNSLAFVDFGWEIWNASPEDGHLDLKDGIRLARA